MAARGLGRSLGAALDAILVLLWNAPCAACGQTLLRPRRGPVCPACWASVVIVDGVRCVSCGRAVPVGPTADLHTRDETGSRCGACASGPAPRLARAHSAAIFDGRLRDIIHAFKYHGHRSLARPLAGLMSATAPDVLREADVLVPVPMHPWRAWRRGFNQAADLAGHLPGRRFAALRRTRHTAVQARLRAARRAGNVRGVFVPARRVRLAGWIAGPGGGWLPSTVRRQITARWSLLDKVVVVVDDVRTTGATLEACADALMACGAREVRALTAALVERR